MEVQFQIIAAATGLASLITLIGWGMQTHKLRRERKGVASLKARIDELAPYSSVRDAEAEASRILKEAQDKAEQILQDLDLEREEAASSLAQSMEHAKATVKTAQEEADRLINAAKEYRSTAVAVGDAEARVILDNAWRKASELVANAHGRADDTIRAARDTAARMTQDLDHRRADAEALISRARVEADQLLLVAGVEHGDLVAGAKSQAMEITG
jgi:vacuolar-type H+-ATPase subunit H